MTKKIVRAMVLGLLLAAGAGWQWGYPWVAGLMQKSPDTFQVMKENFKSFHWIEAGRLAWKLHSLSAEEALALRYRGWKERVDASEEFASLARENQRIARDESREQRQQVHRRAMEGLASDGSSPQAPAPTFGRREPWEFSVALRDQCRKYIEMQWQATAGRGSKTVAGPAVSDAAGKCAYWVPLSDDAQVVSHSLFVLRDKMDYPYYLRLLEALEISSEEVLKFEERLRRMTGSFSST